MPLNPKSLQGLRNLFKPVEAAVSTAPEIKGALTTIAESPQAPSLLEAVMNKDMSRRELMKRGAASAANQAIPRAVQSLVTKELAKEVISPKLQVATEKQILKNLSDLDVEDLGGMGVLDYYLGAMSPELKSHLWNQYQFGLHPSNNKLLYNPEKLSDVQKTIDKIIDEDESIWKQFNLNRDADVDYSGTYVDSVLGAIKNLNLSKEQKALKRAEDLRKQDRLNIWDRVTSRALPVGKEVPEEPQQLSGLKEWIFDLNTPDSEISNWSKGIERGYYDRYKELNPLADPSHSFEFVEFPRTYSGNVIDTARGSSAPRSEYPNQYYSVGDYLREYLKGMEP